MSKLKGIVLEIGGDTSSLSKALKDTESNIKSLTSELKQIDNALKFDPYNMELLAQKSQATSKDIEQLTNKLDMLKNAQENAKKQFESGKITDTAYRELQREIIAVEGVIKGLNNTLSNTEAKMNDDLGKAITSTNKELKSIRNELVEVDKALKLDPDSVELLAQKSELSSKEIEKLSKHLEELKNIEKNMSVDDNKDLLNTEKYRELQREIIAVEGTLKTLERSMTSSAKEVENNNIEVKDLGDSFDKTGKQVITFGDILSANILSGLILDGIHAITNAISGLSRSVINVINDSSRMAGEFAVNQAKLSQVMMNTMEASEDEIKSIVELTRAQERLGVVSATTQIGGAQELSTYLTKSETLKKLIPVMNDMVAQQYGANATQENAVNIATMLGKVMDGQVGALSRYGYAFDEAQENILKFGTEAQRAAVLADVITSSVGGMNEALSGGVGSLPAIISNVKIALGNMVNTFKVGITAQMLPSLWMLSDAFLGLLNGEGSIANLSQAFTEIFNNIGNIIIENLPTFLEFGKEIVSSIAIGISNNKEVLIQIVKDILLAISSGFSDLFPMLEPINSAFNFLVNNLEVVLNSIVPLTTALITFKSVVGLATIAQNALNISMSANVIGLVVVAIAGLVASLGMLYNTNEDFRESVQALWSMMKEHIVNILNSIKDIIETVFMWIKMFWDIWGERITDFFKNRLDGIKNIFDGVLKMLHGIFEIFAGMFTFDWERVWDGVKTLFFGYCQAIASTFINMANFILEALNFLIKDFNKVFDKDVPTLKLIVDPNSVKQAEKDQQKLVDKIVKTNAELAAGNSKYLKNTKDTYKEINNEYDKAIDYVEDYGNELEDLEAIAENTKKSSKARANEAAKEEKQRVKEQEAIYKEEEQLANEFGNALAEALKKQKREEINIKKEALQQQIEYIKDAKYNEIEASKEITKTKIELLDDEYIAKVRGIDEGLDLFLSASNQEIQKRIDIIALTDKEAAARLQAIQDEINGINELTEQEKSAAELKAENEKRARLQEKLSKSQEAEERKQILEELNTFEEEIRTKKVEKERKSRIKSLEDEKKEVIQNAKEIIEEQAKLAKKLHESQSETINNTVKQMQSGKFSPGDEKQSLESLEQVYKEFEKTALKAAVELVKSGKEGQEEALKMIETFYPEWQDKGKKFTDYLIQGLEDGSTNVINKFANLGREASQAFEEALSSSGGQTPVNANETQIRNVSPLMQEVETFSRIQIPNIANLDSAISNVSTGIMKQSAYTEKPKSTVEKTNNVEINNNYYGVTAETVPYKQDRANKKMLRALQLKLS